ncbi:hypothetical protein JZ751_024785 [Albula glossodonta]|uniref:Spermatogenesis-associated protein 1 C-terminal domain-containing protein n=1 Tax=Albula glossodonta TaxID=121402 RepID=A0A8T2PGP0_9TELE|nr:hypothetical protein JZ751_024785 [Albula glossodonta]
MVENSDSVLSRSLTPDRQSYHTDLQMFASAKSFCVPAPKKEATKFPPIKRRPLQQPPPTQSRQDSGSSSSSDEKDDLLSSQEPGWDEPQGHLGRAHERSQSTLEQAEVPPAAESQAKSKTSVMKGPRFHRNHTRDSGVPESLEDRDSGFSLSQDRKSKDSRPLKVKSKKSSDQVCNSPPRLSDPVQYPPPPANSRPAIATRKPIAPVFLTDRDELIKQIKLTKEERKQLERTRQGLLRKGKDLLAQNRYRRNQVRDSWKRKYFDTKKATEPLENTLKSLRQELEAFYHKLLHQLQARDGRHKAKGPGKLSNTKNELIIQIISESNEIDKLKKKVDDAKMKLVAEVKLREQATTELQTLKAELMQKKSQYCLSTRHSGVLGNGVGS